MARQRVLVVGLGIAGITSALRLHRMGWDVVVIEKAASRRQGGQCVALFGTGIAAARRLGIADAMPSRAVDGYTRLVNRRGKHRRGLGFADMPGEMRMLVRGDIEDAAFSALDEDIEIRYSCTPAGLREEASGVEVDILNQQTGKTTSERFDLVIGADGLRSTVRRLAFKPEASHIHRLGYMIATFSLSGPVPGFELHDSLTLAESGRSAWVFGFANRPPTVLFSYRTDDVDAEFARRPIASLRAAYGPEPGPILGWLLDEFEKASDCMFDTAEQVRAERWHQGRVVLIGDSAWCLTLYSGMGASASLAGADLLGTMLERYPDDLPRALQAWEDHLRPFIRYHVGAGIEQRRFFTPANRMEQMIQSLLLRIVHIPKIGKLLSPISLNGKDTLMKSMDIAGAAV